MSTVLVLFSSEAGFRTCACLVVVHKPLTEISKYIIVLYFRTPSAAGDVTGLHPAKHKTNTGVACEKQHYHPEWRQGLLMDFDTNKKQMMFMHCYKRLESIKLDTIKNHHKSRHNALNSADFPAHKKRLLAMKYVAEKKH